MAYNALDLVNNLIQVKLPFPAGYMNPEQIRYLAELYIPKAFDSPEWKLLAPLEAAHRPPVDGNYQDPELYVHEFLKKHFDNPCPSGQETEAADRIVRIPGAVLPFYVAYKREPVDPVFTSLTPRLAIQAGLSFEEFPGNVFLTDILEITKMFLTWQPRVKTVQPDQPEYLDFLTNFSGLSTISLKVKTYLTNGTNSTAVKGTISGVRINSVYRCAVGPKQLGLSADVKNYEIWLENQAGIAISEVRTYRIDTRYRRNQKYLIYQNGLGGWDTLCLTGRSQATLSVKSDAVQRFLDQQYIAADGEFLVSETSGETVLEVSTGYMARAYYNYLQDFFLSSRIYLLGRKGPLPYMLQSKDLPHSIDDETLFGLKLKLKAAFLTNNYSLLPSLTFTSFKTFTASCPAGQSGPSVTRSATADSQISQADADAKALAKAQALAESELVCTFAVDGTFLRTECKPATTELWTIVADGSGGERYGILVDAQAVQCGYVPALNFTVFTTSIAGQIVIDNVVGGDATQPYQYSWNQIDWIPLTGVGGYNNPKTITLPVGGLISVSVRRGTATKSIEVLVPLGTTGTSPTIKLMALNHAFNPLIPENELRLFILEASGGALPATSWIRYNVSRRVDGSFLNNVPIKRGWFYYDEAAGGYDNVLNYVTVDVSMAGTTYDLILEACRVGYISQSSFIVM